MIGPRKPRKSASHGESGYARLDYDAYQTIDGWVTASLCHLIDLPLVLWEPACGAGHMSRVLEGFAAVVSSDLNDTGYGASGVDFLTDDTWPVGCGGIVTNPPYSDGKAEAFVRRALELALPRDAMVAMLLRHEFDCGFERNDLFQRPEFATKITLLKRPRWIPGTKIQPRHNFSWFCWHPHHVGSPKLLYAHPSMWLDPEEVQT